MTFYDVMLAMGCGRMMWENCEIQFETLDLAREWVNQKKAEREQQTKNFFYNSQWTWKISQVAILDDGRRMITTLEYHMTQGAVTPAWLNDLARN